MLDTPGALSTPFLPDELQMAQQYVLPGWLLPALAGWTGAALTCGWLLRHNELVAGRWRGVQLPCVCGGIADV